MISGVNDFDRDAYELADRLADMNCHVNLIPVNTVDGTGYKKSSIERQQAFVNILGRKHIAATVRRTLGSDINASWLSSFTKSGRLPLRSYFSQLCLGSSL